MSLKNYSFIILLLCCVILISCGRAKVANAPANTQDVSEVENFPTSTPDTIENSSTPSQVPQKINDSNDSKKKKIDVIYGKWKILKMVGEGYIYGDVSMKDYVGGIVTIQENYIETDLPLGRWKLDFPKYKLKKENAEDFWMYRHANIQNGFGFKSEQIKVVKVFDKDDEWDEFGGIFWIRDKEHLIILGPVYFLAEKIE